MADEQDRQGAGRSEGDSEAASGARGEPARAQRRPSKRTVSREQRRLRSERRRGRRRRFYLAGGGLIALALIAGLVLPSLGVQPTAVAEPPEDAAPVVGTEVEIQPGEIIEPGEEAVYSASPPSSGPRLATPAEWGFHDAQAPDEAVVRNLEQGAIVFNHAPGEPGLAELRSFIEGLPGYPACYVARPYPGVAAGEVVLTAWGWTHTAAVGDTESMEAFATNRKNQAPLFIDGACGASAAEPASTATPTAAPATATPEPAATAEAATPTAGTEPASTPTSEPAA